MPWSPAGAIPGTAIRGSGSVFQEHREARAVKLVVLGATGGVGSEIVRQAGGRAHEVTAFVRTPERLAAWRDRITVIQGDLLKLRRPGACTGGTRRGPLRFRSALAHLERRPQSPRQLRSRVDQRDGGRANSACGRRVHPCRDARLTNTTW